MRDDCWYKTACTADCTNCIRYEEMRFLVDSSGIPLKRSYPKKLIAGADYDSFCVLADIKDDIISFVNDGKNLYICSDETGNGKTSWAIKLLMKYFDSVWAGNGFRPRGYFQHVPTLFNTLKDFSNTHSALKSTLETVDLVVWDDIASVQMSAYDNSQLLSLLDSRAMQEKSNIFTGNITKKESMEKILGNRLASRVWNSSIVVEFVGKDRRG